MEDGVEASPDGGTRAMTTTPDGTTVQVTTGGSTGNTTVKVTSPSGRQSTPLANGKTGAIKALHWRG